MRFSVLKANGRVLGQSAAVLLAAGMVTGCSSQVARFGGVDDILTASTPNQRQIIPQAAQPYPAEQQVAAAPVDGSYTGSVGRAALAPVTVGGASGGAALPPVAEAQPLRPAAAPVQEQALAVMPERPARIDPQPDMASGNADPEGWSRAGGTQVTVKQGETVYNLSRRFGVPASVILQVNGLASGNSLQAGQKIIIPTYVYSKNAPVSMPDADPKVAAAKSSRGEKEPKLPAEQGTQVAVLPQQTKLKEAKLADQAIAAGAKDKAAASGTYKVAEGDSLSRIAKKHGVSTKALRDANGLSDGIIRVGQTLKIPAGGNAVVADASSPAKLQPVQAKAEGSAKDQAETKVAAYTPPKRTEKLIEQAEAEDAAAPDATGIGRMRWPVRGKVITAFGKGSGKANDGIDISVPEGTPVKAAENGVVIYAGDGLKEFGNTVLVRHEDGLVTVYGHASELRVSRGDKVKRGQELALSGMSGSTDAPKLHFEVRKNSAPVDPATYLE